MPCNSGSARVVCLVLLLFSLPLDLKAGTLFKPAITYPSGGDNAVSIAVADINGDGNLDVVVSNYFACDSCITNGAVGVLLGNGDGTFQAALAFDSGGSGTSGIAVADMNGDGHLDIVVANTCAAGTFCDGNSNTGSVAVLLGNGDGTFQPAKVYSSGSQQSRYLALGDFNRDGKIDAVVADGCGGCGLKNFSVLLGDGQGGFQSPQTYNLGAEPVGITAGDVNGDGKLDLVMGLQGAAGQPNSIIVLLGRGDGTFSNPRPLSPAGSFPWLTDLNGDGKLDLVVAAACSNVKCTIGGVGVLLGNGDGTFQPMQVYSSGGYVTNFVVTADINRDGLQDVLVDNYSGTVGALLGNGTGSLARVHLYDPGQGGPFSMAIGDVNNDGKPDLIVAIYELNNISSGGVSVLLNNTFWTTATVLASSPNPSVQGHPVTLMATVSTEGSISPTGKVSFKNGDSKIGAASLVGNRATLTTAKLPTGSLTLTATYEGDSNSARSTSHAVIQVVNPATE